jgi:hypothetical protein
VPSLLKGTNTIPRHRSSAPSRPVDGWGTPLNADTRRRTLYALLALPVAVASTLRGQRPEKRSSSPAEQRLAQRLLRSNVVLRRRLLTLPVNVVAFALSVMILGNTARNLTYGIWYGPSDYHEAWGGPTLAGAWAVHAAGGLLFLYVGLWIIRGVSRLQQRLIRPAAS